MPNVSYTQPLWASNLTKPDKKYNYKLKDKKMKKNILVISLTLVLVLLLTSCATTYYYSESSINANRLRYEASVNSFGNYNLQGKTFYIESGDYSIPSNDVEFREYANYVANALKSEGAIEIDNKKNADMCILITFGISDESYTETVPVPIWGETGIASISSMSNTSGSAYGSATRIGNSVYGSVQGNSTTNTTTYIQPRYGIVGFSSKERKVTMYRRFLNIYAYDNSKINENYMLWKTNIVSDGSSSELRKVLPAMAYCGIGHLGRSSSETINYYVFEDQEDFICWKNGSKPDPNVVFYPRFYSSNANPKHIVIKKIERKGNETAIEFVAYNSGDYGWFRISPNTYIEYEKKQYKVIRADNIVLGEKNNITKYRSWEFRLIFPAIPSNADYINISEGESPGWKWNGVYLKKE